MWPKAFYVSLVWRDGGPGDLLKFLRGEVETFPLSIQIKIWK